MLLGQQGQLGGPRAASQADWAAGERAAGSAFDKAMSAHVRMWVFRPARKEAVSVQGRTCAGVCVLSRGRVGANRRGTGRPKRVQAGRARTEGGSARGQRHAGPVSGSRCFTGSGSPCAAGQRVRGVMYRGASGLHMHWLTAHTLALANAADAHGFAVSHAGWPHSAARYCMP